ncbi:unnamed protein product [Microthlaspi erraticum]|uniref:Uncharacterized protein n=1 Tax=Microthlaspi erraticum TaxID=1685480 RepID=A0A6D2L0F7_9BRAS|nr:unnamed protein product [Microthlaspi erraticum]
MAGYDCLPMKMKKRKEIARVNDEFSDFSLSSPARKIRRLDSNLQPIMEEDVDLPPIMAEEEIQSAPVNEERAIVLYKPIQPHIFVDGKLISGFKKRFLHDAAVGDDHFDDDDETNKQQAVVPWNQSQFLGSTGTFEEPSEPEIVELDGEDEMMEEAAMDVEEESSSSGCRVSLPQWQQQQLHCMIPQFPQTSSTPISWFP